MKIARVATVPFSLHNHLRTQITDTINAGYEVVLISSHGPEIQQLKEIAGVRFIQVEILRKISPLKDLMSLWNLYWLFRREQFDIVHTTTPKAGAIGAIAAFLARVPIRLHTFTGQPWSEMHGFKRQIVKTADWLIAFLNTRCFADSPSQREFIVKEGVASANKVHVLGSGSLAGVDLQRFSRDGVQVVSWWPQQGLKIPEGQIIITFIGRITADKGIRELIEAFRDLKQQQLCCTLLIIGPEEEDASDLYQSTSLIDLADVYLLGYQQHPESWLAITDIFCLPSYREGFGNVVIEAAAMGVPTVGTDIPGLKDAVADGVTGILVPAKSISELAHALRKLVVDKERRQVMGLRARQRVCEMFDARKINALLIEEYAGLGRAHLK